MRKILVFLTLFFSNLSATISVQTDPRTVKHIELSSNFQNRIAVNQGNISQIIHPGCDIEINLDPTIGQVFVYPMTEYPLPTSLTVVTDEGAVQDFELTFADKPAEIVILETPKIPAPDANLEKEYVGASHPEYITTIVKEMIGGHVPEGFVACDISHQCQKIKPQVRAHLVSKLVSADETIYVWRLVSSSRRILKITEKEANFQKGNWVYLNTNTLRREKPLFAIIGVNN